MAYKRGHRMVRTSLAVDSLQEDVSILDLARMLVLACEEVINEGKDPGADAAVAIITGRIGFSSPADTMSPTTWNKLIRACKNGVEATVSMDQEGLH